MSVNKYLVDYYNSYDEEGRLASHHGSVEFLTTMHYIEKYIKTGDRVLEIGAATGRYSHALARKGFAVDAIELFEHNIELFKQNTQPDENITITQGNAMDLSGIGDNTYNITLVFGPLYHLYNIEDKRQAVSEALRVTKTGGVIFSAYCISDTSVLVHGFKRRAFSIEETEKDSFIYKGLIEDCKTMASILSYIQNDVKTLKVDTSDVNNVSFEEKIRQLSNLMKDGILSEAEFEEKKRELISN